MGLAEEIDVPGFAYLAPQAGGNMWYPRGFLEPLGFNQQGMDSGFELIGTLVDRLAAEGLLADRILLAGFSQGACLALEYAARNARRYGGVAGLSGGLIGPPDTPRDYRGSLEGTPVFLGCSTTDPYIPEERVRETAQALGRLGGRVDMRLYPEPGHMINDDEAEAVRQIMREILTRAS
jgi:predicted esterase